LNECVFSTLGDVLQVEKIKDLEEQRVCAKFCFKLGKPFTETFQMLQQAYGEDFLDVRHVTSGTSVSNRSERPSKTTPNVDDLPRQWTTIALRKCLL